MLFHTGMMGAGAGTPGGIGFKRAHGCPIPGLDNVAADFPALKISGARLSGAWQEESLAIARHKANFYIGLPGWAPRSFPPSLVQYTNPILQDKAPFGTDWPMISVEHWLQAFEALPFKPGARQILRDNARKLLGI